MQKWLESVFSDGSSEFVSNPTPKVGEEVTISLRAYKDAPIDAVFLRTKINGIERQYEMSLAYTKGDLNYYQYTIKIYEDNLHYHFFIASLGVVYYYNQLEISDCMPDEVYDFKILTNYVQPDWVKNAVFYQIFPDRFCNGNKENDVCDGEFSVFGDKAMKIEDWNSDPKEFEDARCLDFYGGDLEGVIEKIPYLKKLGVNAIYLNPIFSAASVHHYDCLDFFHVDKHFDGDEALAALSKKLHENDMKLILDVSINHTGTAHKWFNKEGMFYDKSIGAYNNPDALERNYYFFDGDNYLQWCNVPTLPTLNYQSMALRDIIYKSPDSVVKKWLKAPYNIDGWRFDVADTLARNNEIQLHHTVWPEIRKSIKEENAKAYVLAEDWCDCAEFLQGKEWDSSMNYFGFTRPVREFAGEQEMVNGRNPKLWTKSHITAKNTWRRIKQHLGKLPFVIQENQFNLIDSHDCSRLHTLSDISFDHYRGAVIMLFTVIGATSVYYGDEATINGRPPSMEGCRFPMPWDSDIENSRNYGLYQRLTQVKRSSEAFSGSMKLISCDDFVLSYARFTNNECYVSIISMDDLEREVRIPTKVFMKEAKTIFVDELGTEVSSYVSDCDLVVQVKPNKSYLIKL